MTQDNRGKVAPDILRTERLVGRRVSAEDLPYVVSIDTDMEIQRSLFGRTYTLEESRARLGRWLDDWDQHGFGFWIFRDAQGDEVGHAGIFPSPRAEGSVEVGYALRPKHWNRGYATEMTMASLRIGFETLSLSRIIAITDPANAASRRVLEKCGLAAEHEYEHPQNGRSVRYAIERKRYNLR